MNQPTTPAAHAILPDQSANLHNLAMLQKHFPSAIEVTPDGRYTVNAAQLQLALDPAGVKVEEDGFELRWVGKREAYNTAFTPAQNILEPLPLESKNWDTTGNLLLRGDNLDALRLLRHSYFGKVKLIYIDPPYNTQSDAFIYNDNFGVNQTQILEELGYDKENIEYIKNIYGARTHSGWLSFMYPRLLLAKDLLRDDGVIFISIDDNEQAQLKLLMDEVFGQDNFVAELTLLCNPKGRSQDKYFATNHEYLLAYSKTELDKGSFALAKDEEQIDSEYNEIDADGERYRLLELRNTHREFGKHNRKNLYYPLYVNTLGEVTLFPMNGEEKVVPDWEDGFEGCWTWDRIKAEKDQMLLIGKQIKGRWKIYRKSYANGSSRMLKTILNDKNFYTEKGQKELNDVFQNKSRIFPSPKSPWLLQEIFATRTSGDDLILDFFAGSGTTGEAVMRLNAEDGGSRKFILVQIPQPIDPKKQKEAHKFVTEELGKPATIFEITAERLRRAGEKLIASQAISDKASQHDAAAMPVDIGFRAFEVAPDLDALIFQKPLSEATQADLAHFAAAAVAANPAQQALRQERVLHNLLLSEGLPLTTRITEVLAGRLYLAGDVAIFLGAVNGLELADTLNTLKASNTPPVYLTVYAPWITDDNFLQNIKTQAESLGFSEDKLRLRG
ncbi:MAG: site-specific DNA-methyltransferase [Cytophagales bacterium]|nr:site-specific DNA-methyltransferase [Cytophagales bacterium]